VKDTNAIEAALQVKVNEECREIVDKFMPLIQESLIEGYKDPNEAELDRQLMYPTIVGDMQSINTDIQQFKQAIN